MAATISPHEGFEYERVGVRKRSTRPVKVSEDKESLDLESEKIRAHKRLEGFDYRTCPAWQSISERFGENIRHPELVSIASIMADANHIELDRDARRRKMVLLKWFDENWEVLGPFLPNIVLTETS